MGYNANYSGATGGTSGGGTNYIVAHAEDAVGNATWHWPMITATESISGGTADIVNSIHYVKGPNDTAGLLDSRRSSSTVTTGSIGAAVRIQTAITVAVWIQAEAVSTSNMAIVGCRIAGAGEANNIQWELGYETATDKVRWLHQDGDADNTNIVEASGALDVDGSWHHWAATRNAAGTIVKLYKNGVLDATSGTLNKATGGANLNNITFGDSGSVEFQGMLSTAIVYEAEFTGPQILALYNSTASTGEW